MPISISFSSLTDKMATTAQSAPTLNYLTWANFLLLHKSGFAEPFSVFVTTALIKLVFSSFKIGSLFSVKDLIPKELKSCVVYRFRCAGCGACYVGETSRHICTRINEHLNMDKVSHIFKHLKDSPRCRAL